MKENTEFFLSMKLHVIESGHYELFLSNKAPFQLKRALWFVLVQESFVSMREGTESCSCPGATGAWESGERSHTAAGVLPWRETRTRRVCASSWRPGVPWGHGLRVTPWSLRKTQVDACDVSNTLSNILVYKKAIIEIRPQSLPFEGEQY
jgi:hypothetical protein